MRVTLHQIAPGAPGGPSRWTHSTKEGLGTAYHTGRRWFTLSHGIVDEIYYPTIDQPNTRDFQLLITEGESFCHEEKRHLAPYIEYPEKDSLLPTNELRSRQSLLDNQARPDGSASLGAAHASAAGGARPDVAWEAASVYAAGTSAVREATADL